MSERIVWKVDLMEYERGWGSRVDETVEFPNKKEALAYQVEFNSSNTAEEVPAWYMVATDPYHIIVEDED